MHAPTHAHTSERAACDLLTERLDAFTGGAARLTDDERAALTRIKALALAQPE